jgi:predicted porin
MQKKLIALAVAGLVATPVFADVSNITIGGKLGVGYQDWSNKADAVIQNTSDGNGVAIKGEEDLGGGLKAFFHLETRFDIGTGSAPAYDEASKIGISGGFGSIEFGKVNTVMDKVGYDPGTFSNVNGFVDHRAKSQTKLSNGWLYAGTFGPASVYASHHLSEAYAAKNDVAIGAAVNFGMVDVSAGYQHGANLFNNYLIGAKFSLSGGVVIGTTFTASKGYNWNGSTGNQYVKLNAFGLGAEIPAGPGTLGLSFSHSAGKLSQSAKDKTTDEFGVAYRYPITKRTKIESGVAYVKYKWNDATHTLKGDSKSTFGVSSRLVHEF